MRAMHYAVTLPAAFDMGVIRRRIADKGPLLDGLPGLGFKAWLYAVRGEHGPENRYAPFYLWHDEKAMQDFLLGPGFAVLSNDFGRPAVQGWTVLHAWMTADVDQARLATLQTEPGPAGVALDAMLGTEQARAGRHGEEGAVAAIVGLDPQAWTLVRLQLWRDAPSVAVQAQACYQVGHVSVGAPMQT
jgi:hypothetical protein